MIPLWLLQALSFLNTGLLVVNLILLLLILEGMERQASGRKGGGREGVKVKGNGQSLLL